MERTLGLWSWGSGILLSSLIYQWVEGDPPSPRGRWLEGSMVVRYENVKVQFAPHQESDVFELYGDREVTLSPHFGLARPVEYILPVSFGPDVKRAGYSPVVR